MPEHDLIHPNQLLETGQLPIRGNSVIFAVGSPQGVTSNSWKIWTSPKKGDIYVACRDNMVEAKISLHGSGRWRMAFTEESRLFWEDNNRAWTVWQKPNPHLPYDVIHALEILFPQWERFITPEQRNERPRTWRKNKVYIEEGIKEFITSVSLFVAAKGTSISYKHLNSFPLAILTVTEDSELHVVPHQYPETNLREAISDATAKARASIDDKGVESPAGLYGYFLQGTPDGCRYLYVARIS